MIDSYFRTPYQNLIVNPLLRTPLLKTFSPNLITLLALLSGLATLPLLFLHHKVSAFLCLVASGVLDTLDGSLARLQNSISSKGAFYDLFSDRLVEFSVILGLYFYSPNDRSLFCLLMLGSILLCITSFLTVGVFSQNTSKKSFHYSPGIVERAEAFIFFTNMILFPAYFIPLSVIFSVLVFLTALIRLKEFAGSP